MNGVIKRSLRLTMAKVKSLCSCYKLSGAVMRGTRPPGQLHGSAVATAVSAASTDSKWLEVFKPLSSRQGSKKCLLDWQLPSPGHWAQGKGHLSVKWLGNLVIKALVIWRVASKEATIKLLWWTGSVEPHSAEALAKCPQGDLSPSELTLTTSLITIMYPALIDSLILSS